MKYELGLIFNFLPIVNYGIMASVSFVLNTNYYFSNKLNILQLLLLQKAANILQYIFKGPWKQVIADRMPQNGSVRLLFVTLHLLKKRFPNLEN
jgi:hypothetical protein